MLTKEQIQKMQKLWLDKKPMSLQMNFSGRLAFSGTQEQAQAALKRVSLAEGTGSETGEQLPSEYISTEGDFVEVTYRALSAAMLGDRPIDFSNAAMLKKAVPLLNGHTVFKDHDTSVNNWVGRIISTNWDTKTAGAPPGINAVLKLDTIKDPMTVRGVLQGAIHSASVTVSFQWKPSHEDLMNEGLFWQRLGEEVNGEVVRMIVSQIEKFWEISLVWQGADTYAKQIDDEGEMVQQSAVLDSSVESFGVVSKQETEENIFMEEFLKQLKALFGQDVSADNLEQVVGKFSHDQIELGKLAAEEAALAKLTELANAHKAEVAALSEKISAAEASLAAMKADAELGVKYLADERTEAVRLCKLAKGEKVSQAILKTLEVGSLEVVQAWKSEFAKEVEEKYPAKCESCHGTKITRQSSKKEDVASESASLASNVLGDVAANKVRNLHG